MVLEIAYPPCLRSPGGRGHAWHPPLAPRPADYMQGMPAVIGHAAADTSSMADAT
jgi:hypothetical protein